MEERKLKSAVEAILFACGTPVEVSRIAQALDLRLLQAQNLCDELAADYANAERGIRIVKLNDKYQMCTVEEFAGPVRTVMDLKRNTPLSQAASEVLAVIAYLPGRPLIYGTTEHFLRCFNISSIEELPPLPNEEENSDEKQEHTEAGTDDHIGRDDTV